ncbi:MAG: hypothetical protein AAF432_08845 [Planctomycetota bacterium]
MSKLSRQTRLTHLCCATFAGLATMSVALPAFGQAAQSLSGSNQGVSGKVTNGLPGYKIEVLMGPIDGLTTGWHKVPEQTAMPLGTVVELRASVPEAAAVTWSNAYQTLRTDTTSFATAVLTNTGMTPVSVRVDFQGKRYKADLMWDVQPVALQDIGVANIRVVEETIVDPHLDGMALNNWTMDHYFGASVASVTELLPGRYLTSIQKNVTVEADVHPAEFAPLVEWRDNGVAKRLGTSVTLPINTVGLHALEAGRPGKSAEADVIAYQTVITSHNVQPIINDPDQEYFEEGTKIGLTAVTIPAGYEEHITWMTSTKYGTAEPVLGSGPNFYCVFNSTVGHEADGSMFQWLGVKADNHVMGQDQKSGACCLPDGSCFEAVVSMCASAGGAFQGNDSVCADVNCPLPPVDGGCCLPDGSCFDTANGGGMAECDAAGGDYQGNGVFCADVTCPPPPATNDECVDRVAVNSGSTSFDLSNATNSGPNEPDCNFPFGGVDNQDINQDLWYNYTADCTGTLFVDTCGTDGIDTRIAIYEGCGCDPLGTLLECNDDHGNADEGDSGLPCDNTLEASLSIQVTAGQCYKIRVGAFSAAGGIGGADVLNITCVGAGGGGACCLPDGSCLDAAGGQMECDMAGGTYQGDGSLCVTVSCPQPLPCGPGNGDCFAPNGTPGCDDTACCELICGLDAFCCETEWDQLCVDAAAVECNLVGGACCFADGSCALAADMADCMASGGDYQGDGVSCTVAMCPQPPVCGPGTGDCFVANGTPGCDDVACCELICGLDAFCCDTSWDQLCADAAAVECNLVGGACCFPDGSCALADDAMACRALGGAYQGDGIGCGAVMCPQPPACGPGTGDCFAANGTPGCDDVACCELICGLDAFCCDTSWDQLCADAAAANCNLVGGACCFPDGSCALAADMADCMASGGDYQGDGNSCAAVMCPQPPACGPGTGDCFSANGTPGCDDVACCELICGLDAFCCDTSWDQLCADAAAVECNMVTGDACCLSTGECLTVMDEAQCTDAGGVYQGAGTACTPNPCPQPSVCGPGAGDCNAANGTPGCENVACCELICGLDAFCCDTEWDQLCADAAALETVCAP